MVLLCYFGNYSSKPGRIYRMHIYFIGIGGTGVGPLAIIACEAGYEVSGSDNKASEYTRYLEKKGIRLFIDQSGEAIKKMHGEKPIDWVVSVSAIIRNNPDHPELVFARENAIRTTERDVCLNEILKAKGLKMIAAAGTHGKTTSTAMLIWLFKDLGLPISYSVGAKTTFSEMGHYEPNSEYFIYECDEFHRNFLHFYPHTSIISGIAWDHHEVFPSREDYNQAFREFFDQTAHTILWDNDASYVGVAGSESVSVISSDEPMVSGVKLAGLYNRRNAWLAVQAVHSLTGASVNELLESISKFPGIQRRMEEVIPNIFTDYAHTPEKIIGCMSVAIELAAMRNKKVVVIYEPLTNRRQHFMKADYKNCFAGADHVYWVPSYLSREDPGQPVLSPDELIRYLDDPGIASAAEMDDDLWKIIEEHASQNSIVICMTGGGGNSLDEWLRLKARALNQ